MSTGAIYLTAQVIKAIQVIHALQCALGPWKSFHRMNLLAGLQSQYRYRRVMDRLPIELPCRCPALLWLDTIFAGFRLVSPSQQLFGTHPPRSRYKKFGVIQESSAISPGRMYGYWQAQRAPQHHRFNRVSYIYLRRIPVSTSIAGMFSLVERIRIVQIPRRINPCFSDRESIAQISKTIG